MNTDIHLDLYTCVKSEHLITDSAQDLEGNNHCQIKDTTHFHLDLTFL